MATMLGDPDATGHLKALRLSPGEEVLAAVQGRRGKRFKTSGRDQAVLGALVLTGQRIAFVRDGFFSDTFEAIPLDKVSSVELKEGLLINHMIYVSTSEDEMMAVCTKPMVRSFIAELERVRTAPPKRQAEAPPAASEPVTRLRQLGELHRAGVLTDEEFERAKAALLREMG